MADQDPETTRFINHRLDFLITDDIYVFRFNPDIQIPGVVFLVAVFMSHSNSAINYFIYSWRLKQFRDEINKMILHYKRKFI